MKVCCHHGGKLGSKIARDARRKAASKHGFFSQQAINEREELSKFIKENNEQLSDALD